MCISYALLQPAFSKNLAPKNLFFWPINKKFGLNSGLDTINLAYKQRYSSEPPPRVSVINGIDIINAIKVVNLVIVIYVFDIINILNVVKIFNVFNVINDVDNAAVNNINFVN